MKRILTVFAALAMAAGLASSCQKEGAFIDNPAQGKLVQVNLTAAFEGVSKVTYSETDNILTPAWEMDDEILVINPTADPSVLTVASIDGDGYATLTGGAEPGLVHLVYKKGIDIQDWEDSEMRIDYDNQYINEDMPAVMFADGTVSDDGSGSFTFSNAGAVIGICNAKGVPGGSEIDQVTIIGSNLSAATVSISGNALVLEAEEIAKDTVETVSLYGITVENGETGALSEEILIAVPCGAKVEKVTLSVGEDTYSYTLTEAVECAANDYLYVKTQQFKKDVVTTGTAKRTGDIEVNWVQLWENGPKFAEYNVGASSATDTGDEISFAEATENFTWGPNWCTPSEEQMNELLLAAQGNISKVTCVYTYENGKWGFKFTGIEEGYKDNSVFFHSKGGHSGEGYANYWSATAHGNSAWLMYLCYDGGNWFSQGRSDTHDNYYFVRPVLKN